jgi:hypothetical protein
MNPSTPSYTTSLTSILILSSQLRVHLSSGLFRSGFENILQGHLIFLVSATSLTNLVFLDLIILIILGKELYSKNMTLNGFWHFRNFQYFFGKQMNLRFKILLLMATYYMV